jgi:hypothetical protein
MKTTYLPLAILSMLLCLSSCKKEVDNSPVFISFDTDGSNMIVNKDISLNNFNSGTLFPFSDPQADKDSVIIVYNTSVSYGSDMILTLYYFIWEETSKIKYGDFNYRYYSYTELENGLKSCSNNFLPYPDTILHRVLPGTDDSIISLGTKRYQKSGLFVQLTDFENDKIYLSDILSNSDVQQFQINDSWIEESFLSYGYLVYISGVFDLTLRSVSDDQTKELNNGEFQISMYQTEW